ncbi:MAG TPA: hypothetical protein VF747_02650, partial [Blastocatellia bacterium]
MKFSKLAQAYDRIGGARGDAGKIPILANLLKQSDTGTLEALAHFTLGEVVDPTLTDDLGIGPGNIRNAIARLAGKDPAEIEDEIKEMGDIGEVAAAHIDGADSLTVAELWKRINRAVERGEDRQKLIESVFRTTGANGAKYFSRMVLNQMRIGVGHGTMARAIASAFNVDADSVQRLYAMSNDIGLAAVRARRGQRALVRAGLELFRPYQFMNAHKVDDPADIFRMLGGKQVIFEVKYDGVRLQIHIRSKRPRQIKLFSRRLNDDTASMPDVVEALASAWKGGDAIVEGEAV